MEEPGFALEGERWFLCNSFGNRAIDCGPDKLIAEISLAQKSGPIVGDRNGWWIEMRAVKRCQTCGSVSPIQTTSSSETKLSGSTP